MSETDQSLASQLIARCVAPVKHQYLLFRTPSPDPKNGVDGGGDGGGEDGAAATSAAAAGGAAAAAGGAAAAPGAQGAVVTGGDITTERKSKNQLKRVGDLLLFVAAVCGEGQRRIVDWVWMPRRRLADTLHTRAPHPNPDTRIALSSDSSSAFAPAFCCAPVPMVTAASLSTTRAPTWPPSSLICAVPAPLLQAVRCRRAPTA